MKTLKRAMTREQDHICMIATKDVTVSFERMVKATCILNDTKTDSQKGYLV